MSATDVCADLGALVSSVNRGWAKLPPGQKRRALRRLIQKLDVGAGVIDIYYYLSEMNAEVPSVRPTDDSEASGNVIQIRGGGKGTRNSKLQVKNCLSLEMVSPPRLERGSTV